MLDTLYPCTAEDPVATARSECLQAAVQAEAAEVETGAEPHEAEGQEGQETRVLPAEAEAEGQEARPLHLLPTIAQTTANAAHKTYANSLLLVMSHLLQSADCGMTGNTNS